MNIEINPKGVWYHGSNVELSVDVIPHPRTTMEKNAEFLTARPLKVRLLGKMGDPRPEKDGFSILRPEP